MKKIFLVLGLSFLLTACGEDSQPTDDYDEVNDVSSELQRDVEDATDNSGDSGSSFNAKAALKEAIEVCNSQVESLPESERAGALETCECTARNTDLEALFKAENEQDFAAIQEIMTAGLEACLK